MDTAMTFEQAMQTAEQLRLTTRQLSQQLQTYPKGPMGLTPESVRVSPEYRADKAAYDAAFTEERNYNMALFKMYPKKQISAYYLAKRTAR